MRPQAGVGRLKPALLPIFSQLLTVAAPIGAARVNNHEPWENLAVVRLDQIPARMGNLAIQRA
jgi:hypothetical protein